jgi:hypothetical protein
MNGSLCQVRPLAPSAPLHLVVFTPELGTIVYPARTSVRCFCGFSSFWRFQESITCASSTPQIVRSPPSPRAYRLRDRQEKARQVQRVEP